MASTASSRSDWPVLSASAYFSSLFARTTECNPTKCLKRPKVCSVIPICTITSRLWGRVFHLVWPSGTAINTLTSHEPAGYPYNVIVFCLSSVWKGCDNTFDLLSCWLCSSDITGSMLHDFDATLGIPVFGHSTSGVIWVQSVENWMDLLPWIKCAGWLHLSA